MALEGFGKRLRAVRQERGYTQNQLANLLGVTEQAVSKYERGNSYPDVGMLDGISRVLDCSLDYLFQFESGRRTSLSQESMENRAEVARYLLPDIITLEFGEDLVPLFLAEMKQGFPQLNCLRQQIARQWGVIIPAIRLMDQMELGRNQYQVRINGVLVHKDSVENMRGNERDTLQPDVEILIGILSKMKEKIWQNIGKVLTNQSIYFVVENLKEKYPYVVEGIIPEVISYSRLRQVVICLLRDLEYTVSPLALIVQAMERYMEVADTRELAEKVSVELGEGFRLDNWGITEYLLC